MTNDKNNKRLGLYSFINIFIGDINGKSKRVD